MNTANQILNKSAGCFVGEALLSVIRQVHRAAGCASETITITSNRQQPSLQPSTCVSQHPESLRVHPPLLSPTERWLSWQPCCHGSIYFGADLDLGWLHIQPSVSDQMRHTYTLAWSAAGSWVSADLEGRSGSRSLISWGELDMNQPLVGSSQGHHLAMRWDVRIVHLLSTSWQAEIKNHWLAYENDAIIMATLVHTEEQDRQFNPKLPTSASFSLSQWVTLVFNTHTHTNDQTLVLLQMSHPPQADNYSVSDGVRWRVVRGTGWGRGGVRWREQSGTMIHHHSARRTHSSSATGPLQPPASSLAACPRVTRWHQLFFHVLQLHATPIKPWAAPLLHNNTPAADWQEERQTTAAIGHKSFGGWQLPPNVDCFLVIFKPLVSYVCVCGNICWV